MVDMDTKSPLGELIESARKLADYSQQDVADRATSRGYRMSKQNVGRLVNDKPLASIKANWIKGIAAALGLSESRVAAAALASMGVNLGKPETQLREAILDATEIDERTKRTLLAILDIEQKEGMGRGKSPDEKSVNELLADQIDAQDYDPDVDSPMRPSDPEASP